MPMRSPARMALATRRAPTPHGPSSGVPMAFSEGARKAAAPPGDTPLFARTRAQRRSTSASRARPSTTPSSGSRNRQRANQPSIRRGTPNHRHYTATRLGPSRKDNRAPVEPRGPMPLNQRAQGGEDAFDDLGREGPAFPLFEGDLARVRLVQLEHLLHLGGEVWRVDLDVRLVVAEQAVAVDVRRADRGPDAVNSGGLGVDHYVLVEVDPHPRLQELPEVPPGEPVGRYVV